MTRTQSPPNRRERRLGAGFACIIAGLVALELLGGCSQAEPPEHQLAAGGEHQRLQLDLSGSGWQLWLDRSAAFEEDEILLPPVDLSRAPVNPPSGGWESLIGPGADHFEVSVPGTVEEHAWDALAAERRAAGTRAADDPLAGDYVGVSWWWRELDVPESWFAAGEDGPRHLVLQFEAVRQRAEVFVNRRLVGRDDVGNTPFACDVTSALQPGRNVLAVRVTDPGGNFDWRDHEAHLWGARTLPASHGFGGLTGPVRLSCTGPVRFADAWVVNTANPQAIELHVELENLGTAPATVAWGVRLRDAAGNTLPSTAARIAVPCPPGRTHDQLGLLASAAPWSPASPVLHVAEFELTTGPDVATGMGGGGVTLARVDDSVERRFGFRSFTVDDEGGAAVLRLNGERIVLRSAISWGFWPVSGMVPTQELARRQVEAAKSLGLNMLNHHRGLAAPGLLDLHDELGLLAYEEPGGYACAGGDETCRELAREKLLRMVRRDRSHPSLVIVNLINEETEPPTEAERRDLADAHALDPDVVTTFTSGWSKEGDDSLELHARPGETELREQGWWDYHNAPGPGAWRDNYWSGPAEYRRRSENTGEVVFWGEEGAIASPPRLSAVAREVGAGGAPLGWDGVFYRDWAAAYERFLDAKGLRRWFPTLDAVTVPLADVAYDYQARTIHNVRLGDVADGYVINGWECEPVENHSGIVDLYRNVKGDGGRLAAALAPTCLVLQPHATVLAAGEFVSPTVQAASQTMLDVYLVDETERDGPHVLSLALRDAGGQVLWSREDEVVVHGGDAFGEPLVTDLLVAAEVREGPHALEARLHERGADGRAGTLVASASDELWVVDWRSQALPVNGAVLEHSRVLRNFFRRNGRPEPEAYFEGLKPVDFILVGDFDPEPRDVVPEEAFVEGQTIGHGQAPPPTLNATAKYVADGVMIERSFMTPLIDADLSRVPPLPDMPRTDYEVTWQGVLWPKESGRYAIHVLSDDGVRLWIGEPDRSRTPVVDVSEVAPLIDNWEEHEPTWDRAEIDLEVGRAYPLRLEYCQREGGAQIKLCWTRPSQQGKSAALVADLLRRAREDGTTLCFLDKADRWATALARAGALEYGGKLEHGKYWLGGGFLAREHQLFHGLPTGALGRVWQESVQYGATRFGLRLSDEECLCFCVSDHQHEPATAVGVVPCGKGRILLSTLDLYRTLNGPPGPADATRRYFVNVVQWAGAR